MHKALALAAGICLLTAAGAANAAPIFADGFETPVNTMDWQVYRTFGDWTATQGAGIEIQLSGVVVNAHGGNQYVELDSDPSRGGINAGSNSAMTRTLSLGAGTYQLEWYYRPRTNDFLDNTILVYLDGASDPLLSRQIGLSSGTASRTNDWVQQTAAFTVDGQDNLYRLTFVATGTENSLGGFIDDVSLTGNTAVPEPATFALLGAGLLGLLAARRRLNP